MYLNKIPKFQLFPQKLGAATQRRGHNKPKIGGGVERRGRNSRLIIKRAFPNFVYLNDYGARGDVVKPVRINST